MPSEAPSCCSAVGLGQPAARRAAGHQHDQAPAQLGVAAQHLGRGPQQHVGGLERLDATGEREHDGVRGDPHGAPRVGPRAGGEPGQVDARRDGDGAGRVGAVELDELADLGVGVADQPVGLGDDLVLADHPDHRLGRVARGQRGVLDPGQGVRAVHQRHAPAVAGQPAGLPGQPVVRVHDVVVAGLVGPRRAARPR